MFTKKEIRSLIKVESWKRLVEAKQSLIKENQKIDEIILNSPEFKNCNLVLAYMALEDEVNLENIIAACYKSNKMLALPRIDGNDMNFYYSDSEMGNVEAGYCGISEPDDSWKILSDSDIAGKKVLVLIPGRAFTSDGKRLGRGKGFYDRYLSYLKKQTPETLSLWGVSYSYQIFNELPVEEQDVILDKVIFCLP